MNASTPLSLGAALAMALVSLTACNRTAETDATPSSAESTAATETPATPGTDPAAAPATDPATGATPPAGAASPDGDALGVLAAINEHEVAAAMQAKSKGVKGKVLEYANMMETEHNKNLAETRGLDGKDGVMMNSASPDVTAQRSKGEAELAALGALEGDAYEKAYIDAMVKGHTDALAALDGKLIPAATVPAVKDHLTKTRGAVQHHLDAAKALQTK